jgi:hypothetical protein
VSADRVIYDMLYNDFLKADAMNELEYLNFDFSLQFLLDSKIAVLVYNGQNDLSVPCSGSMRWVYEL